MLGEGPLLQNRQDPKARDPDALGWPAGRSRFVPNLIHMDVSNVISFIGVTVSILSLMLATFFSIYNKRISSESKDAAQVSAESAQRSVDIAQAQLELTLDAQRAALSPYVWADLRARDDASTLTLQIGNSGPTVARDIKVAFDPPLPAWSPEEERQDFAALEQLCKAGLGSLAPGRTFMWDLGVLHKFFPNEGEDPVPAINIKISATDSTGRPIPDLSYIIQMEDLKHQAARAQGLALVEKPLKEISKTLADWKKGAAR